MACLQGASECCQSMGWPGLKTWMEAVAAAANKFILLHKLSLYSYTASQCQQCDCIYSITNCPDWRLVSCFASSLWSWSRYAVKTDGWMVLLHHPRHSDICVSATASFFLEKIWAGGCTTVQWLASLPHSKKGLDSNLPAHWGILVCIVCLCFHGFLHSPRTVLFV